MRTKEQRNPQALLTELSADLHGLDTGGHDGTDDRLTFALDLAIQMVSGDRPLHGPKSGLTAYGLAVLRARALGFDASDAPAILGAVGILYTHPDPNRILCPFCGTCGLELREPQLAVHLEHAHPEKQWLYWPDGSIASCNINELTQEIIDSWK